MHREAALYSWGLEAPLSGPYVLLHSSKQLLHLGSCQPAVTVLHNLHDHLVCFSTRVMRHDRVQEILPCNRDSPNAREQDDFTSQN